MGTFLAIYRVLMKMDLEVEFPKVLEPWDRRQSARFRFCILNGRFHGSQMPSMQTNKIIADRNFRADA